MRRRSAFCEIPWLRTNGANTNGVTAKVLCLTDSGKKLCPGTLGNEVVLNATKPKSKKQQPWITTNANNARQATLHAICMYKVVSVCTQVYGYVRVRLFIDKCQHTQKPNTRTYIHVNAHARAERMPVPTTPSNTRGAQNMHKQRFMMFVPLRWATRGF